MTWLAHILLLSNLTFGEYRVYELSIENADSGKIRQVRSVLDHLQYREYYPVLAVETVKYVRSWKCWGRSDYETPLCPGPGDGGEVQQKTNSSPGPAPASTNP